MVCVEDINVLEENSEFSRKYKAVLVTSNEAGIKVRAENANCMVMGGL